MVTEKQSHLYVGGNIGNPALQIMPAVSGNA
jgi:hypothetical protein